MRKLLVLLAVLALLAIPAVPAVAVDTATETVTGTFTLATIDVTAPNIPDFGMFQPGANANVVNSSVPDNGDITVTENSESVAGWTVTAKDLASPNAGYMKQAGDVWLLNMLEISNGGAYFGANVGTSWTGTVSATDVLPTWLRQTVDDNDAAGDYSITLTYTGALSF